MRREPRAPRVKRAKKALLRNQEYKALVENSPDVIVRLDKDLRRIYANPAACTAMGISPTELMGTRIPAPEETMPELREHAAVMGAACRRVFETGLEEVVEFSYPTPQGVKYFQSRVVPEFGQSGVVETIFTISRDITEQKRAEQALRHSEERLRLALSVALAGAWWRDLLTGSVVWSPENYMLYGVDPALGIPTYDLWKSCIHPDDLGATDQAFRDALEQKTPEYRSEFRMVHPLRGVRWLLGIGRVVSAQDGAPIQMIGINIDITERKQMEEQLLRSRKRLEVRFMKRNAKLTEYIERLKLATELAKMGVWELDVPNEKLVWDDRIYDLLGIPAGATISYAAWNALVHPEDVPAIEKKFWREICERGHGIFECRIIRPSDGALRHIQCAATALFNAKREITKVVGVYFDVTERKRAEEEQRAIPSRLIAAQEEERKRLAGELHDSIGQTLAALKFRIEHIHLTLTEGNAGKAIAAVDKLIPVLQRSIEETRAIYMGLRPRILEDLGIVATLNWYRNEFLKLSPHIHIELQTRLEERDIAQHLCVAIFRIAQEALNNVSKHSKAEWVDLTLKDHNEGIELIIADDGIGMDVDYILTSSTAKSLGLTGMKERAELTGGEFLIESTPGKGTTVRAFWPIADNSPLWAI